MDPAQFQPLPAHLHIERYIPQTLLLPQCDAVIFHGGYNSLHSTLWHGLPMIITPLGAGDQYPTGLLCEKLGAGIMVKEQPPEPDSDPRGGEGRDRAARLSGTGTTVTARHQSTARSLGSGETLGDARPHTEPQLNDLPID